MKVIATAKIIAARIRPRDRPPVVLLTLIMFSQRWPFNGDSFSLDRGRARVIS